MMKPMKKILALVVGLLTITNAIAQIPYFAGTVGDGKLYGYSSVKARPGITWKFDQDVDVAAGFYYTFGQWNLYVWGNDFLKDHPRFIVGLDFAL